MSELENCFGVLRYALQHEGDLPTLTTSEWWSLFRLLQQNHVAALCYEATAQAGVPREVLMPWLAEREKAMARHRYQHEVQQDIVGTMQRHGIQTLVLKGTQTARHWPMPELREFGDIDLYFYNRHHEADHIARTELKAEISNDTHHHTKYGYRGVMVESHYNLLNAHYPPSNREYECKWLRPQAHEECFEALFLLRHMAGHFASARITLRDLCDWVLLWKHLPSGLLDGEQGRRAIEDYGMLPFASALHTIAERRLGMWVPDWGHATDEDTVRRVEHDIVYGSPEAVEHRGDGIGRLGWKIRRWKAMRWKRRLVYNESEITLLFSSLTSHASRPRSILHKI